MRYLLNKYHGIGNDYFVFDPNTNKGKLSKDVIKKICDRNYGIGSDGILYGPVYQEGKIGVKIYNPDGSEAEKSGNGVRIFAKYLFDAGYVKENKFILSTLGGEVEIEYLDEFGTETKVFMGMAEFDTDKIPVEGENREIINQPVMFHQHFYNTTCVSVGNPHCVIMMEEVNKKKVTELGPYVEHASCFKNRINLQLLKVKDRKNIQIEIYERGAGYTLASGTSGCAAAAAAYKMGLVDNRVTVHMPGGSLKIEIGDGFRIYMTGTVEKIGRLTVELEE